VERRSILEVGAAILTAVAHFYFYAAEHGRAAFLIATVVAWSAYITIQIVRDRRNLTAFGLSKDGLRETTIAASIVFGVGALGCLAIGLGKHHLTFNTHMLPVALLYPAWGVVQQLLVQAMVVRNLTRRLPAPVVVAIAAVLFGVVHLPYLPLAAGTAALGAVFALIFIRYGNVIPLGICHGWLGVLFYFWVLHRDPWQELIAGA
jgi:membrane protease YdiL (CAAX protease family)